MWDLILSVPDHCLSFYFVQLNVQNHYLFSLTNNKQINVKLEYTVTKVFNVCVEFVMSYASRMFNLMHFLWYFLIC